MRRVVVLSVCFLLPLFGWAQGMPFGPKKPEKPDTVLIIHAGVLLSVPGEAPLREQSVVVRNDRIAELIDGYVAAESVEAGKATVRVIDLRDRFVMPGMLDAHVHLARATGTYQSGSGGRGGGYPPVANGTVNAVINARLNLAAGFTAVRDLGSDPYSVFAVRDAINDGNLVGPTILGSGASISVTAGHGDDAADSHPDERARAGVCDGADECRTLVRHLEKTGSDLIKFKATGGFSSNTGLDPHMTPEEMQAIVAAAHLRGIKVTTHAYDPVAIIDAVNAGIDSLEHGYLASDEGLRLMKRNGVYLVPTLTVADPPSIAKRFMGGTVASSVIMRDEAAAFERAYEMGVNIAFGTDCGIYPHGNNADELVTMVGLGMKPADALRSATVVNAELFGVEGLTGTIEPGVMADIIAVSGSPLEDISRMKHVDWVIKSGQVVKEAGKMTLPLDYSLPQKY